MVAELRKRAKARISDANPRFLTIIGLLEPGTAVAGRAAAALVAAFTGGLWPTGHLVLDSSTLRFEGDWSNRFSVGRRVAFTIALSTVTEIRAGSRFLKSRIVTLRTRDGEVLINPIWGGVDTDVFLIALRQAVMRAGGRA